MNTIIDTRVSNNPGPCPDCRSRRTRNTGAMRNCYSSYECEECGCRFHLYFNGFVGYADGEVVVVTPGRRRDVIAGRAMDEALGRFS